MTKFLKTTNQRTYLPKIKKKSKLWENEININMIYNLIIFDQDE